MRGRLKFVLKPTCSFPNQGPETLTFHYDTRGKEKKTPWEENKKTENRTDIRKCETQE